MPSAEHDAVGGELLSAAVACGQRCPVAAVGTVLETDPVSVVCPPSTLQLLREPRGERWEHPHQPWPWYQL